MREENLPPGTAPGTPGTANLVAQCWRRGLLCLAMEMVPSPVRPHLHLRMLSPKLLATCHLPISPTCSAGLTKLGLPSLTSHRLTISPSRISCAIAVIECYNAIDDTGLFVRNILAPPFCHGLLQPLPSSHVLVRYVSPASRLPVGY